MAKDLIENQIIDYYDINNYLNKSKKNNDVNNCNNFKYKYKPMIYFYKNDFKTSTVHILSYLRTAIINILSLAS